MAEDSSGDELKPLVQSATASVSMSMIDPSLLDEEPPLSAARVKHEPQVTEAWGFAALHFEAFLTIIMGIQIPGSRGEAAGRDYGAATRRHGLPASRSC